MPDWVGRMAKWNGDAYIMPDWAGRMAKWNGDAYIMPDWAGRMAVGIIDCNSLHQTYLMQPNDRTIILY